MSTTSDGLPLSRRQILSAGLLTATGLAAGCATAPPPEPKPKPRPTPPPFRPDNPPNIVFVMLDDAGYGDIEPGPSKLVKTPRMDRFAAEGMTFRQMYTGASTCTPSRAALLTGRYAPRVGLPRVLEAGDEEGLSEYERTLPEILHDAGYRTGMFGKWHLGELPRHNPVHHGFDRFVGIPRSSDQGPRLLDGERLVDANIDTAQLTRRFTDEAIRFIEKNQQHPFFVYLPYSAPHIPLKPEPAFQGTSAAGDYGDVLAGVDFHFGRLLDTLSRLGLTEDTIVVLTSDNGPWYQGSTGGLRGRKTDEYEGGVRLPFHLRWPSQVRAGSVCDAPASFIDMLPTFAGIAGGRTPTDRPIDGLDISVVLQEQPMPPREALYFFHGWDLTAIRSGDWKLHIPRRGAKHNKQLRQLFNVRNDPGEKYDLSGERPAEVRQLQQLAARFSREIARQRPRAQRRASRHQ